MRFMRIVKIETANSVSFVMFKLHIYSTCRFFLSFLKNLSAKIVFLSVQIQSFQHMNIKESQYETCFRDPFSFSLVKTF